MSRASRNYVQLQVCHTSTHEVFLLLLLLLLSCDDLILARVGVQ
jgi:hypothetical protein